MDALLFKIDLVPLQDADFTTPQYLMDVMIVAAVI